MHGTARYGSAPPRLHPARDPSAGHGPGGAPRPAPLASAVPRSPGPDRSRSRGLRATRPPGSGTPGLGPGARPAPHLRPAAGAVGTRCPGRTSAASFCFRCIPSLRWESRGRAPTPRATQLGAGLSRCSAAAPGAARWGTPCWQRSLTSSWTSHLSVPPSPARSVPPALDGYEGDFDAISPAVGPSPLPRMGTATSLLMACWCPCPIVMCVNHGAAGRRRSGSAVLSPVERGGEWAPWALHGRPFPISS